MICNEEKDLWHLVQHATVIIIGGAARDDLSSFGIRKDDVSKVDLVRPCFPFMPQKEFCSQYAESSNSWFYCSLFLKVMRVAKDKDHCGVNKERALFAHDAH